MLFKIMPYLQLVYFFTVCIDLSIRAMTLEKVGRIIKVYVSYSLIAVGEVGVRVPLYLGHS